MTDDSANLQGQRSPWTPRDRELALAVYYQTGSYKQVKSATGVPKRTMRDWLVRPNLEEQRQAVKDKLSSELAERAADLAAETRQVLTQSVRATKASLDRIEAQGGTEDGTGEAKLLTAVTRTHEVLDRIARLDEGKATEIHGITMAPADIAAFQQWHRARHQRLSLSPRALIAEEDAELREILAALPAERLTSVLRGVPAALPCLEGEVLVRDQ